MTKDVIELAREAGFGSYADQAANLFQQYAALVAARERERCAQLCEEDQSEAMEWDGTSCPGNYFAAAIRALNTEDAAIAAKGGSDG